MLSSFWLYVLLFHHWSYHHSSPQPPFLSCLWNGGSWRPSTLLFLVQLVHLQRELSCVWCGAWLWRFSEGSPPQISGRQKLLENRSGLFRLVARPLNHPTLGQDTGT